MSDTFLAPNVTVREQRAGIVPIRGVSTTEAGMAFRCLRGPANRAIKTSSPAQFRRIYGDTDPNSYGPDSADLFYKNRGSTLWCKRILGSSGGGAANTKASVVIQDTAAAATAITGTAIGEGLYGNAFRLKSTKNDFKLGLGLAVQLAASAQTSCVLTASVAARVRVGDTLRFLDSAGGFNMRVVVTAVRNTTITFSSTTPTGILPTTTTMVILETFTLTLFEGTNVIQGPTPNLRMSSLSAKDYVATRINTGSDEAQYTVSAGAAAATNANDNRPTNVASIGDLFSGGDEFTTFADADYIGSSGAGTGLYAFDLVKTVRMLAVPGVTGTTAGAVTKALLDYCSNREDCVAFASTPLGTSVSAAKTYKNDNLGTTSYGVFDYPWLEIIDPLSSLPTNVPPEGARMGVCVRTINSRGIAKSPAGIEDGRILGVRGVERVLTDSDRESLYPDNINPIEKRENGDVCFMGSRTMESGEYNQIHVRFTMVYLRLSIKDGTQWVLFEPNTDATRARVRRSIDAFLKVEWRRGTLEGASEQEAFTTVCDTSNNPPEVINANQMWVDSTVRIPRTTENLVVNIRQDAGQEAA